jgi:anti-sigma factor RsiW
VNKHLGEGTLQALLDGGLPPAERPAAEAHLAACGECAAAARELRAVNERAAALLAQADIPAPVAQAQMSLRARRLRAGRWGEARKALLRAAILVLGVAGVAAAAVPGSPVREWVEEKVLPDRKQALQPTLGQTPAEQPQQPAAASAPSGVSIRPDAGVVRVVLTGASPKLRVTARLVDTDRAGVLARGKAASGARFRTAPGRIEVVNAGEGELEVEIPRDARAATVQVNGHVYVAKDGDSLRVLAPADAPGAGPDVRVGG